MQGPNILQFIAYLPLVYVSYVQTYTAVYFLHFYRELAENKKAAAALNKELTEATLNVEISARQELVTALEEAQRASQEEKEQLLAQIEDLRLKIHQAEEQHLE
jgi:hypothetical protein